MAPAARHRRDGPGGRPGRGGRLEPAAPGRALRQGAGPVAQAAAMVLRFERSRRLLERPARPGLAEVAVACGYYDQAHLSRDWRSLAGCTSTAWMAAELPSVKTRPSRPSHPDGMDTTSHTAATVWPALRYADAPAAIRFLSRGGRRPRRPLGQPVTVRGVDGPRRGGPRRGDPGHVPRARRPRARRSRPSMLTPSPRCGPSRTRWRPVSTTRGARPRSSTATSDAARIRRRSTASSASTS